MKCNKNVWDFQIFVILMCLAQLHYALSECNESEWECDNGQCIAEDDRCDGKVHCTDGSDEIAENCIQFYKTCPPYAFKCRYGACVADNLKCNEKQDCADNSDELICLAPKTELELQGRWCKKDQMQCGESRECIDSNDVCNGRLDCSDGSDETLELCIGYSCPDISFTCGYGACINGNFKCNGKVECADGSDEAWELCNYPRNKRNGIKTSTSPTVTRPGPTITRPRPVTQPQPTSTGDCEIPIAYQTEALIFKLHPHNDTVQPGTVIEEYGTVHIECKNGFFLKGTPDLLCENGKWNLELSRFPTCATFCDRSKIQTLSTVAICSNRTTIYSEKCPKNILPNTEVELKCAYGFTRPQNNKIFLKCMSDGSFDETPVRCDQQECGKISPSATGLSVGGVSIKPSQAPWHVAIHLHDGVRYKYFCSGSIISSRIVISAAHCFWDEANDKLDNRQFQIIAGKKSKTYEAAADERPQIIDVEQIYIPKNYTGRKGRHLYDIAVVKLKIPLQYNEQCSPICIKTDYSNNALNYVAPDIPGFITAFDGVNNQLERLAMTTVDYHNCKRESPTDTPLATDKFCIRNKDDGAAVCRGDSGAAFVTKYENFLTDEIIYNLYGVISNTPFTRDDCASSYVAVTSISYITSDFRDTLNNLLNQDKILF